MSVQSTRSTGIQIPSEVMEKYSQELKKAWVELNQWWISVGEGRKSVIPTDMPKEVKNAFDLICRTEIPDHPGKLGSESWYIITIKNCFEDN